MNYKDFDGGKTYDLHGKSIEDLEKLVDRLSITSEVVHIITGSGRGVLKDHLRLLQKQYGFRILNTSSNDASFVVDFS
jgi:dsDNA-specific endonuclease/ATPase MutS2